MCEGEDACVPSSCLLVPRPPGIPAAASLAGVMGCLYPVSLRSRPMASCPHNTARNARKHCSPLPPPALLDSSIPPSFPWPNLYCPWWKPCQGSRLGRCLKGTTGCEQTWGRRGQTAESGDDEEATDWKEPDDKSWGKSDKWKLTRAEYQGSLELFSISVCHTMSDMVKGI